ncbi:hypothetical protein Dimus_039404 [Dionaea muscipula]
MYIQKHIHPTFTYPAVGSSFVPRRGPSWSAVVGRKPVDDGGQQRQVQDRRQQGGTRQLSVSRSHFWPPSKFIIEVTGGAVRPASGHSRRRRPPTSPSSTPTATTPLPLSPLSTAKTQTPQQVKI